MSAFIDKTRSRVDAAIVIAAAGHVDMREMLQIKKHICEAALREQVKIVLSLKSVEWVSAWSIGVLAEGAKMLRNLNGDLKLAEMSAPVRQIFAFVGMDPLFEIYATVGEAIEAFDEEWEGVGECQ